MKRILIQKQNGVIEPFDPDKLRASLLKAGATNKDTEKVVAKISRRLNGGETTSDIYRNAFELLKKVETGVAARYSMRRALADLGPSGFPFEVFISRLFEAKGYSTHVDTLVKGRCATHEVDLLAENGEHFVMGEVKFHNQSEIKSDLKIILYIHARYLDLVETNFNGLNKKRLPPEAWLITNTKFTDNVINYSKCANLKLLGWNYPQRGNLQDLIEDNNLEPLTILTTLSNNDKLMLMNEGKVLCNSIITDDTLERLRFPKNKIHRITEEAQSVCHI